LHPYKHPEVQYHSKQLLRCAKNICFNGEKIPLRFPADGMHGI